MVLEAFSTIGNIVENVSSEKFENKNKNRNNEMNNNNLKKNMNLLVNPALDMKDSSPIELLGILLLLIVCTLPAVVISVRCNPKSPILMGIVAFLFDRIYLLQHVVRKYMLKEKGYCKNIVVN